MESKKTRWGLVVGFPIALLLVQIFVDPYEIYLEFQIQTLVRERLSVEKQIVEIYVSILGENPLEKKACWPITAYCTYGTGDISRPETLILNYKNPCKHAVLVGPKIKKELNGAVDVRVEYVCPQCHPERFEGYAKKLAEQKNQLSDLLDKKNDKLSWYEDHVDMVEWLFEGLEWWRSIAPF